jgi:hypothetical protein
MRSHTAPYALGYCTLRTLTIFLAEGVGFEPTVDFSTLV